MIQTMHQHSQIDRANILDWLRHCDETAAPHPSPSEIAGRFGYESIEAARTLLADLADRGEISIDRHGAITVSSVRPKRAAAPTPRIDRSVKRAESPTEKLALDKGVARIMEIINGPAPAPATIRPAATVVVATPAPAPTEQSAKPAEAGAPAKPASPRQVTFILTPDRFAELEAAASAEGIASGRKARNIVEAALDGACIVPLPQKPAVPVSVLFASIQAGRGLHEFVAELINRGLADWQRENAR